MTFRASPLTSVSAFVTLALVVGSGPTLEGQQARGRAALMNPAELNEQAPATFRVNFDTSKGSFVVEVHRDWAPTGVDRFYNLVKRGFYDGNRFFRVLPDYLVQFGISGDPEVVKVWVNERLFEDDPVIQSNLRGYITYIPGGAGRRVTQLFINLVDNPNLDASRSAPFGQVVSGMNIVDNLYAGYGENAPHGNGPTLNRMRSEGNAYLEKEFPDLDYIKMATIVP